MACSDPGQARNQSRMDAVAAMAQDLGVGMAHTLLPGGAQGAGSLYEPDPERLAVQRRQEPRGVTAGTSTASSGAGGGGGGGPSWPQRRRNAGTVTEEPLLEYASLLEQRQAQREQAAEAEAAAFDVLDPLGRFRAAETQRRTSVFQGAGAFASSGATAAPRPQPQHFPEDIALNAFRQPAERMVAGTGGRDFGGGYASAAFESTGAPAGFGADAEALPTRAASAAFATFGQRQLALGALRRPATFDIGLLEAQGRMSALLGVGDDDAGEAGLASAMMRRAASASAALSSGAPFGNGEPLRGPPSPRRLRGGAVALPLRPMNLGDEIALRQLRGR